MKTPPLLFPSNSSLRTYRKSFFFGAFGPVFFMNLLIFYDHRFRVLLKAIKVPPIN